MRKVRVLLLTKAAWIQRKIGAQLGGDLATVGRDVEIDNRHHLTDDLLTQALVVLPGDRQHAAVGVALPTKPAEQFPQHPSLLPRGRSRSASFQVEALPTACAPGR